MKGLDEFDVVGLNFEDSQAFLCEVSTHIRGLSYKTKDAAIQRVREKFKKQKSYAKEWLGFFEKSSHFMFWAPSVKNPDVVKRLRRISGLEIVVNEDYTDCVETLRREAKRQSHDVGNPAFRLLQILEHMKKKPIGASDWC